MSLDRLGLIKTSLIDYPGEVSAVLFTAGCNLRCPFCHNPELVGSAAPEEFLPLSEILAFLQRRSEILGGVCVTGGEPLIHADLTELIGEIKHLGLKVKIDTNGSFPARLCQLEPDYVALDVKTSPSKYNRLTAGENQLELGLFPDEEGGTTGIWPEVKQSIDWVISSGTEHEFRTTVVPELVSPADVEEISGILADAYARHQDSSRLGNYVLAGFRAGKTLDPSYMNKMPYADTILQAMKRTADSMGLDCSIRWNKDTAE